MPKRKVSKSFSVSLTRDLNDMESRAFDVYEGLTGNRRDYVLEAILMRDALAGLSPFADILIRDHVVAGEVLTRERLRELLDKMDLLD